MLHRDPDTYRYIPASIRRYPGAARVAALAHSVQRRHAAKAQARGLAPSPSLRAEVLHFLGEVEAVFGIWVLVLIGAGVWFHGWPTMVDYIGHRVNFTEPMFVRRASKFS